MIGNTNKVTACKSKGLSDESIKPPASSNNSLAAVLVYCNTKLGIKLDGSC